MSIQYIKITCFWFVCSFPQSDVLVGLCWYWGSFKQTNSVPSLRLGKKEMGWDVLGPREAGMFGHPGTYPALLHILLFPIAMCFEYMSMTRKRNGKTFLFLNRESKWNLLAFPVLYMGWSIALVVFRAQVLNPVSYLYVSVLKGPKLVTTATVLNLSQTPPTHFALSQPFLSELWNKTNIVP